MVTYMSNSDYPKITYKLTGYSGTTLFDNAKYTVQNPIIHSIYISDNLTQLVIELNKEVHYSEHKNEIEDYVDRILLNLAIQPNITFYAPNRELVSLEIPENNRERVLEASVLEKLQLSDFCKVDLQSRASGVYRRITESINISTNNTAYTILNEILQNPSLVVQYISLYELLLTLVPHGKDKPKQLYVTEYLKEHKKEYTFVQFVQSNRPGIDTDSITFLRNQISHCVNTNNSTEYKRLGEDITIGKIKQLALIIYNLIGA